MWAINSRFVTFVQLGVLAGLYPVSPTTINKTPLDQAKLLIERGFSFRKLLSCGAFYRYQPTRRALPQLNIKGCVAFTRSVS